MDVTAIVEYDYTAKEQDELDLRKGAIICRIKQMPGGWWQGTLNETGETGMFPDNFVRVIDSNEDSAVLLREKAATENRRCKVIYSYTQVNDDELSLAVGDVIEFLGEVEEGWWRGRLRTKVGVFPSNFVQHIEASPILASKRPPSSVIHPHSTALAGIGGLTTAITKPTNINAANPAAAVVTTTTTTSTKKTNRLSFHNSKEDLLNTNNTTTSSSSSSNIADDATTVATAVAAAASAMAVPILPPKPQRDFCRVEYPYAPQNSDELELMTGDIITIISMDLPDKGWWKGELRGKVGVFPDNFVKLLAASDVAPLNEPHQPQQSTPRAAKTTNASQANQSAANTTTAANLTSLNSNHSNISNAAAATTSSTKVFIKKSGSTSSTQSTNRKDSFGSRDSLIDILSETGLPTGNVAAQRKSLENKNLDLNAVKKQQNNTTTATNTTTIAMSTTGATSESRNSVDSLDDKTKSPPPVLTKKPTVPTKKSTTVTSVAGNLLSGLKQKVKNVENKLTTTASHDYADGVGSSKMSPSGLPDTATSGNVVMRRAATISGDDTEFDRVERASMLQDLRAGRVRAPKRRPPSTAINISGENNNNSVYLNGSGVTGLTANNELLEDGRPVSSDENSMGEEQLAKPKPREWEKKKVPWMDELKASQVKKKTSPNVEPRTLTGGNAGSSAGERTSKILTEEAKILNTIATTAATSSVITSAATSSTSSISATSSSTTTKVQSSSVTSSGIMQQSMTVESNNKKEHNNIAASTATTTNNITNATKLTAASDSMSKSMNTKLNHDEDLRATRPNSLSIRNRSISPLVKTIVTEAASTTTTTTSNTNSSSNITSNSTATATSASTKSAVHLNNHHGDSKSAMSTATESSPRVLELEKRMEKLEFVVQSQQRTIDDLVRMLREETDRVRLLRGELEKYAQCVTQV